MIAKTKSGGVMGVDGFLVEVEADLANGLPAFDIVGLPDAAVKESKDRVRAAISNSEMLFPTKRITVNLAPADIKKEGPAFDLPIAIGILRASGQITCDPSKVMFLGELSLDGKIRPVPGVLPLALAAKEAGLQALFVAKSNAGEAAVVEGLSVYGAETLGEVVAHLNGNAPLTAVTVNLTEIFQAGTETGLDFSDVKGQDSAKRALEIAAAGGHNCLMIGPPGSGKTMLAKRLPTILPDLTLREALEVTKIYSVAGLLPPGTSLLKTRPFRSPHHTISGASMAGGGSIPKPGEVSLAHLGVLFLDELTEFRRDVLEVLRQPLEDKKVNISRVHGTVSYPCENMLVASMNPCRCGHYGDPSKQCTCTASQIQQYYSKISGPLLDRIDIHIEVPRVPFEDLRNQKSGDSSETIRARVNAARAIQQKRYEGLGIYCNAQLEAKQIETFCPLGEAEQKLLRTAFDKFGYSARAHSRVLKLARTIADLDASEQITVSHLAEAIQYRTLDKTVRKA